MEAQTSVTARGDDLDAQNGVTMTMTLRLVLLAAAALLLGACASTGDAEPVPEEGATTPAATTTSPAAPVSTAPVEPTSTAAPARLVITVGDVELTAVLRDTAAARDLLAQLPVTVTMTEHGGVEKTGPLPAPLSTDGEPDGADPDVADLGYYAPGNDLVLYHGDQSYFPGIVVLGRLQGDAGALADLDGPLEVRVRTAAPSE